MATSETGRRKPLEWVVVENPEPNPWADAWLDYLDHLGRIADRYSIYIGGVGENTSETDHVATTPDPELPLTS